MHVIICFVWFHTKRMSCILEICITGYVVSNLPELLQYL